MLAGKNLVSHHVSLGVGKCGAHMPRRAVVVPVRAAASTSDIRELASQRGAFVGVSYTCIAVFVVDGVFSEYGIVNVP